MAWTLEQMEEQSRQAVCELLEVSGMTPGQILVVGCSSSEVVGGHIGKASSLETAQAIFRGIWPVVQERGIFLAAQCCEHLNRALIIEAACAEKYGYEPVCVVPSPRREAPLPPRPGRTLPTRWRWSTSGPTVAWTLAAPSSGCT